MLPRCAGRRVLRVGEAIRSASPTITVQSPICRAAVRSMPARPFPPCQIFCDHRKRWRWCYELGKQASVAASYDSYASREECERLLSCLRSSSDAPIWIAKPDLTDE